MLCSRRDNIIRIVFRGYDLYPVYLLEWAFQYLNKEAIKKKLP